MASCPEWSATGLRTGSLGPIPFFLIYINDLDCGITNWILKFADDTKIFGTSCDIHQRRKFQEDLTALFHWSTEWQMLFNVDKYNVMHFGKHNAHYDYTLNNKSLVKVTEERDLGIVISGDLKVSQQCSHALRHILKQASCWVS